VIRIVYTVLSIAFVSTSVVALVENHVEWLPQDAQASRLHGLAWTDALYLIVVTLATIG
jgi:hypothetical protein